jgi:hypothetical protein
MPPVSCVAKLPASEHWWQQEIWTMFRNNMDGRGMRRLGLLIGLVLALAGCGQLASQQPPISQQAPLKLPPL